MFYYYQDILPFRGFFIIKEKLLPTHLIFYKDCLFDTKTGRKYRMEFDCYSLETEEIAIVWKWGTCHLLSSNFDKASTYSISVNNKATWLVANSVYISFVFFSQVIAPGRITQTSHMSWWSHIFKPNLRILVLITIRTANKQLAYH